MANIMRLGGGGGGAQLAVTLNEDGTQNLFITENGDLPDLAAVTVDADANAEDVLYGKTFYAMGVKKVGSLDPAPALLWTNESPTSNFQHDQTISLPVGYSGYIVEIRASTGNDKTGTGFVRVGERNKAVCVDANGNSAAGDVTYRFIVAARESDIVFGYGGLNSSSSDGYGIPTRIWGVNFTL